MGQIHVDDMSVEQVCTDLCDFTAKSVGVMSRMGFARIGLMVALEEEGHVLGGGQGLSVPNLARIGAAVAEI